MIALQPVMAASLLALLVALVDPARADPGEAPERPDEAPFDDPQTPLGPPGKTGRFQLGAGFLSDEGFIARAQVAQDDLFRTGTKLVLDAQLSARQQRFALGFEDPALLGTGVTLRASVYDERRVLPGFTRHAVGSSLTLSHALGPQVRGFVGYRLEQIDATPDAEVSAHGMRSVEPFRGGRLAALRAGIEYDTLDDPLWPRRGTRVGTSIEVADRALGSQLQLIRTDAWWSHHRPLGALTLHVGGTLSTVSNGAPFSERLHFDGNHDVRGYAPGALGPRDPATGMSLGGNLKYTARGELEAPLVPAAGLSAVGWVDTGGLLAPGSRWTGTSVGVGLAWRSPIGLLRVDYAVPLDGGPPRVLFSLGGTW